MSRRIAAWLALPLLALAACGGRAATAEPVAPTTTPKPVACNPGQHQSTPEAYYDCVNGAWKPGTAPTPTTTTPPATVRPRPADHSPSDDRSTDHGAADDAAGANHNTPAATSRPGADDQHHVPDAEEQWGRFAPGRLRLRLPRHDASAGALGHRVRRWSQLHRRQRGQGSHAGVLAPLPLARDLHRHGVGRGCDRASGQRLVSVHVDPATPSAAADHTTAGSATRDRAGSAVPVQPDR